MDINHVYQQLTNVDITEQKALWDERGKGYYGEYLVFCELYKYISGNPKILMNLNIPTKDGKTTEIDLLMIHETGLYVFEIKHYKGTIYGSDTEEQWTQYFRTTKNSVFKNPVGQNRYHIDALMEMFPDVPIHSVIVFTSTECTLKIKREMSDIDICLLGDVLRVLNDRFRKNQSVYSMKQMDSFFSELSNYSQMQEEILIDGESASFFAWVGPVLRSLKEEKNKLLIKQEELETFKKEQKRKSEYFEKERQKEKKKNSIIVGTVIALCVVITIVSIAGIHAAYNAEIEKNNQEVDQLEQNFLHVDEIGGEYLEALNTYVRVIDIDLKSVTSTTTSFSAKIVMDNELYGMRFTKETKYIVMTRQGVTYEFDMFGDHLKYNYSGNMMGKGIRTIGTLATATFSGVSKEDIKYIKANNITLFKLDMNRTVVEEQLELELYKK